MPLAWRGLAGCLVRRLVAVVCVCSACGGGRIATRELACGERTGERGFARKVEREERRYAESQQLLKGVVEKKQTLCR